MDGITRVPDMFVSNARFRHVFKYRRLPFMVAWTVVVTTLLVSLWIRSVMQAGWSVDMVFFPTSLVFVSWYGGMIVLGASDIVVDEIGVSRKLFMVTWARIAWTDMSRIVCCEVYYSRWQRSVVAYNIFPCVKSKIRLLPSGKLWITGNIASMESLREAMNEQALRYGVPIQRKKNGVITPLDRLM